MERDPNTRITVGVGIGKHAAEVRPVLLVNGDDPLVIESTGLNELEAALLVDGYVDGLCAGEAMTQEMISSFLNDPPAIAGMDIAVGLSAAHQKLRERGVLGGLRLAAEGYWFDAEVPTT